MMSSIPPYHPREMAFDPRSGRLFASVTNGLLAVDAKTGMILWRTDRGAESRVEIGDHLVFALNGGTIVALEIATGTVQWEQPGQLGGEEKLPKALLIGNHLLALAPDSRRGGGTEILTCYTTEDGRAQWDLPINFGPSRFEPCLALDQETVVFVHEGSLHAHTLSTGNHLWSFTPAEPVREAPTIQNNVVYCGAQDDMLYALNLTDGSVSWQSYLGNELTAAPLAVDQTVYVPAGRRLTALDGQTRTVLWRYKDQSSEHTWPRLYTTNIISLAAAEGMLGIEVQNEAPGYKYDSSYSRAFIALDTEKGMVRWRRVLGEAREQIIGSYQQLLFLADTDLSYPSPHLVALDASTGQPIRSLKQEAQYLIAEGMIYAWSDERLAAFTAESGSLLWEIPFSS